MGRWHVSWGGQHQAGDECYFFRVGDTQVVIVNIYRRFKRGWWEEYLVGSSWSRSHMDYFSYPFLSLNFGMTVYAARVHLFV